MESTRIYTIEKHESVEADSIECIDGKTIMEISFHRHSSDMMVDTIETLFIDVENIESVSICEKHFYQGSVCVNIKFKKETVAIDSYDCIAIYITKRRRITDLQRTINFFEEIHNILWFYRLTKESEEYDD